jgi:hypothetical protein
MHELGEAAGKQLIEPMVRLHFRALIAKLSEYELPSVFWSSASRLGYFVFRNFLVVLFLVADSCELSMTWIYDSLIWQHRIEFPN